MGSSKYHHRLPSASSPVLGPPVRGWATGGAGPCPELMEGGGCGETQPEPGAHSVTELGEPRKKLWGAGGKELAGLRTDTHGNGSGRRKGQHLQQIAEGQAAEGQVGRRKKMLGPRGAWPPSHEPRPNCSTCRGGATEGPWQSKGLAGKWAACGPRQEGSRAVGPPELPEQSCTWQCPEWPVCGRAACAVGRQRSIGVTRPQAVPTLGTGVRGSQEGGVHTGQQA